MTRQQALASLGLTALLLMPVAARAAAPPPAGAVAPKPLYRDPVHDGAADPTVVWNRARHEWWMFYTNRRADYADQNPRSVRWVHGTRIGIAVSKDHGATWKYHGVANISYGSPDYTYWAPQVVDFDGLYHMYLAVVPGTFDNWNAPRAIVHLTSRDLVHWKFESKLDLGSDRVIDPSVFRLPDGHWRMWYKDERDHSYIHYADSDDLYHWKPAGIAAQDRGQEAPVVFQWHNRYWLLTDTYRGLGVYSSADAEHWERQSSDLLVTPGTLPTDRSAGHHPDVIVSGSRAFLFYFTQQTGADNNPRIKYYAHHSVIQVTELELKDGVLSADRDKPTRVWLSPPNGRDGSYR